MTYDINRSVYTPRTNLREDPAPTCVLLFLLFALLGIIVCAADRNLSIRFPCSVVRPAIRDARTLLSGAFSVAGTERIPLAFCFLFAPSLLGQPICRLTAAFRGFTCAAVVVRTLSDPVSCGLSGAARIFFPLFCLLSSTVLLSAIVQASRFGNRLLTAYRTGDRRLFRIFFGNFLPSFFVFSGTLCLIRCAELLLDSL